MVNTRQTEQINKIDDEDMYAASIPQMKMNATKFVIASLFIFVTCSSSIVTSTNISVILEHCLSYPDCYESSIDQFSTTYYKSLVKLLSGGVNQFLWEYVSQEKQLSANISLSCRKSLRHVWSSITKGHQWAFQSRLRYFCPILDLNLFCSG